MVDKIQKQSVIKNYVYNVSYQIINIIIPLITAPYISRTLGAENIGRYSYTSSIVTYFITFAILGTEGYARREIAYRKGNKKEYSKIFWEIFIFRMITTIISLLLFSFIIFRSDQMCLFLIQALNILSVGADISWLFQGLEEFSTIVIRNYIIKIITIIGIFAFVRDTGDLSVYVFLIAGFTFISNICLCFAARRIICRIPLSELKVRKHVIGIIHLFIPTIAVSIYAALDKTMLGIIAPDMLQNGYYEQAEKIIKMLITVVNALGFVLAPRIAEEFSKGNRLAVKEYMKRSYHFIWILALPMMVGIYSIADMVIPWFYGAGYQEVIPVMKLLSAIIPIISFSTLTGVQYLISTKKESFYTISLFIGALVNFICNLILIPHFYACGAAAATVIGESSIAILQMLYVVKKEQLLKYPEIFGCFFKCLFSSLIMFAAVSAIKAYFNAYTMLNTIFVVILGGGSYFCLLYFGKDKMMMEIVERLKGRFRK